MKNVTKAKVSDGVQTEEKKYFLQLDAQEDVRRTPSSLRYQMLKEGNGKRPLPTSQVLVHYEGKLVDGSIFDSSVQRQQAATFRVCDVIPGFAEGLQLLMEGGKIRLHIPPAIGYGKYDLGVIPPNSILIFEVELLKVL